MKVYLAERIIGDDIDPIGIYNSKKLAEENLKPFRGLITEMELDITYNNGIGSCKHFNIGGKEEKLIL